MTDVKRPILLQLGSSQNALREAGRPREQPQKELFSSIDRSSVCSSQSSTSSSSNSLSSSNSSELSSPSLILPYLYVGDQAQTQIDTISSLNISYILSLQSLPKFLSGSSQTTPSTTTTTKTTKPSSPGQGEVVVEPIKSQHSSTVGAALSSDKKSPAPQNDEVKLDAAGLESKFDIIDGADGGLLPSVNSSKDYLVKIKHLANGKNLSLHQGAEKGAKPTAAKTDIVQPMDIDDDESFVGELRTLSPKDRRTTSSSEIKCASASSSRLKSLDGDDETLEVESAIQDDSPQMLSNEQYMRLEEALLSDGLVDDHDGPAATSSCSLKQRCNRLSSSVHRLIKGKCINISDTFEQLLDKFFDETHSFIEEARRNKCNVLVHCKAGISRSPTIAIAYLMKWKRLHLQDAYNFVKRCRPQISPNLNFMGQLVSYERQLQRDRSHLPSPISSCMPSLSMSCSQQMQQQSVPSESQSSSQSNRSQQARAKNGITSEATKKVHVVPRRSNQNSIDTNSYDSNSKRARVRRFFRRKS